LTHQLQSDTYTHNSITTCPAVRQHW